jgi:type VI secretion system Hcp family effector
VTKAVDRSSPLLFSALTDNQVVDAKIKVIRADPSGTGAEEEVLRYTLTGGSIVGHRINVNDIPNDPPQFETETLSLSFSHFEMEWVNTGAVATWDWLR